jgi:aromatic ring-opening dioxygenase LigB subunit
MIRFAAIAPHGDVDATPALRAAMDELGRRFPAHDAEGPYGFHPAAAAYDAELQELLRSKPLDFRPLARLVEAARADSLWQLLVLQGAVRGRVELLAYAAPSYYGMAVAVVA